MENQKQNTQIACGVFITSVFLYALTAAPTVALWDCGEFIATSYILGIPHPPGAPLYTLLGRLFALLPFGNVAFQVNLLSVLSGAASVALIYLIVTQILKSCLSTENLASRLAIPIGGLVAAFSIACSSTFWSNATEAEVYALSIFFTLLVLHLALQWDRTQRDGLLFLIAYIFGLSAGVHLLCLLTLPGILILVFRHLTQNPSQKRIAAVALIAYPLIAIVSPTTVTVCMTLAIVGAAIYLQPAWRTPSFWIMLIALGALGYSTYLILFIRSGLNPAIDLNNPETWQNFWAFLTRQQYGLHTVFPRRGDFWDFQLNIFIKYFLQQFPHLDELAGTFRRAVTTFAHPTETTAFSLLPLLLGLGGIFYHLKRDAMRFAALFAMFLLMGFGLVLYLNMPDPEPRERDYIFVGAYTLFGCWIGIGAAGLIVWAARFREYSLLAKAAALLTLTIPIGIFAQNLHSHDRSQDHLPRSMAYNLLQTCEPDSILFTNGDNDTYPLWYLQYVEGVRPDVRVVCLSLLQTPWYIKQLRDGAPSVPLNLDDNFIDQNFNAWDWSNPRDISVAGLNISAKDIPTKEYGYGGQRITVVEPFTWIIWRIVQQNNGQRPIYFAITVPTSNSAGLRPYLSLEGMAFKLTQNPDPGQYDFDRIVHNLNEVYTYESFSDITVYKDPVAQRLLGNYLLPFAIASQTYLSQDQPLEALSTLQKAEQVLPPAALGPNNQDAYLPLAGLYQQLAIHFADHGELPHAITALQGLLNTYPDVAKHAEIEALIQHYQTQQGT